MNRVVAALFWDRGLSPLAGRLWVAALLLTPLALAAGAYLQFRMAEKLGIQLPFSRQELDEKARLYAASRGFETKGWNSKFGSIPGRTKVLEYLLDQGEDGRKLISSFGIPPPFVITYAQGDRRLHVLISSAGIPYGHWIDPEKAWSIPADPISTEEADGRLERQLAELRRILPAATVVQSSSEHRGEQHSYTYRVQLSKFPRLVGVWKIRFWGKRTDTEQLIIELDAKQAPAESGMKRVYEAFLYFVMAGLSLFAIVRYVQRARQREVSRARMWLVTAVNGGLTSYMVLGFVPPASTAGGELFFLIFMLALMTALGALFGIAYAATEGDMREFLPASLTSVDALLSGRAGTRNVARAFVLGVCLAAWTLLLRNTIYWLAQPARLGLEGLETVLSFGLSEYSALLLLLESAMSGIVISLAAFLLPATAGKRFIRDQRTLWVFVFALSVLILAQLMMAEPLTFAPALLVTLVKAAAMLIAVRGVDVLAGIVVCAAFNYLASYAALWVSTSGSAPYLEASAVVLCVLLVGAVVVAYRGRVVADSEVRPKYARDIVERQQLENEMEAAREAQMRLLPQGMPKLEGATLAARCEPAQMVSGDFFDFFPLSASRLGILITDGGSRGLDTALVIALVKGYLKHRCHSGLAPRQLLASLFLALGEHLKQGDLHGLCYGVLDARERRFDYARVGETPAVMIANLEGQTPVSTAMAGSQPCWEGTVSLPPGAVFALYTNGVRHLLGEPDALAVNRWLRKQLQESAGQPLEALHQLVWSRLFSRPLGLGQRTAQDDVTVMLVQMDPTNPASSEKVA